MPRAEQHAVLRERFRSPVERRAPPSVLARLAASPDVASVRVSQRSPIEGRPGQQSRLPGRARRCTGHARPLQRVALRDVASQLCRMLAQHIVHVTAAVRIGRLTLVDEPALGRRSALNDQEFEAVAANARHSEL
eukprot:scaffold17396_cov65-Phaeocystis_antarctica.AAC.7